MSDLFYIYISKLSGSLFAFKEKQPEYMVRNDEAFECVKVSNDIDSYIYKLQHDIGENLKEINKLKRALEIANTFIKLSFHIRSEDEAEIIEECAREAQKQIKEVLEG